MSFLSSFVTLCTVDDGLERKTCVLGIGAAEGKTVFVGAPSSSCCLALSSLLCCRCCEEWTYGAVPLICVREKRSFSLSTSRETIVV